MTQSILTEQQMANFGNNPKEELLTHERILLQTIKFDLQVQHPYSYLLKFAKSLKGERNRVSRCVLFNSFLRRQAKNGKIGPKRLDICER